MATGDYHHTALAAARGVGMVPPQGQVVIIQAKSEMKRELTRRPSAIKRDEHDALSHAAGHAMRSVAFADPLAASGNSEHQGLVFHVENGNAQQDDASQALAAIAQVSHQAAGNSCCIVALNFDYAALHCCWKGRVWQAWPLLHPLLYAAHAQKAVL